MALFKVNFFSESLGMESSVIVVIPQKSVAGQIGLQSSCPDNDYKVLYLLHGLSDDETIWMRRTSIERYASRYGIVVVMPNGHRSFYTDMKHGGKYYEYITHELPIRIKEFFRISGKREDTYIAGLSMGGYGALKAALREPGKYAAASGLSAVVDIDGFSHSRPELFDAIFGNDLTIPEDDDLYKLIEKHKNDSVKPKLFIGIGKQDGLYDQNQPFRKALSDNGYDLTYRESDGVHSWEFWDEYILYTLEWMFGGKR